MIVTQEMYNSCNTQEQKLDLMIYALRAAGATNYEVAELIEKYKQELEEEAKAKNFN